MRGKRLVVSGVCHAWLLSWSAHRIRRIVCESDEWSVLVHNMRIVPSKKQLATTAKAWVTDLWTPYRYSPINQSNLESSHGKKAGQESSHGNRNDDNTATYQGRFSVVRKILSLYLELNGSG